MLPCPITLPRWNLLSGAQRKAREMAGVGVGKQGDPEKSQKEPGTALSSVQDLTGKAILLNGQ